MAIHRIKQELSDIEIKQQELERQGVTLEQKIRLKFDTGNESYTYIIVIILHIIF